MMMKAEQFVLDAFWGFVTRSLYNLGEDFSSPKKTGETANHEKPPLPLGVLLMIASLIVTGACVAAVFLAVSVAQVLRGRCLAHQNTDLVLLPRRGASQDDGFIPQPGRGGGEGAEAF